MNQLDLNTKIAAVLDEAETKLRAIVFEAGRAISQDGQGVELLLEHDMKAFVDGFKGIVHIASQPVGNVAHLLEVLKALEARIASGVKSVQTEVSGAVQSFKKFESDLAATISDVQGIEAQVAQIPADATNPNPGTGSSPS
jgi:hypothetical protein